MLTIIAFALALSAGVCNANAHASGLCTIENTGSSVEVGATRPGGGSSGGGSGGAGPRDQGGGDVADPGPTCADPRDPGCYTFVVLQPTLNDVASFAPASLPLVDEPDGVGIVGMPVNFVVEPAVHEQTGELFDLPVTVRFTPASVQFRHGDGTSRDAAGGGRTWAQLGLPQFSATPTSHAYAARGTYTASAVVRYAAAVDFGSGWVPVPGLLEIPTAAMDIQILEVRTALVDRTCHEKPTGPGC